MTPEQHYAEAEAHAKISAHTSAAANEAATKHAILAVAHALLAMKSSPDSVAENE